MKKRTKKMWSTDNSICDIRKIQVEATPFEAFLLLGHKPSHNRCHFLVYMDVCLCSFLFGRVFNIFLFVYFFFFELIKFNILKLKKEK